MSRPDLYDLERFLPRQAETHAQALAELTAGRKITHWIWWEMPQLRMLGRSQRAHDYGLADLAEATDYLRHPVMGPRLIDLCNALLQHKNTPAEDLLGHIDALKVRSTGTLFSAVTETESVFSELLDTFYEGQTCPETAEHIHAFRNSAT